MIDETRCESNAFCKLKVVEKCNLCGKRLCAAHIKMFGQLITCWYCYNQEMLKITDPRSIQIQY